MKEVQKLNNCIVIGETGSGKTTQIPQVVFHVKNAGIGPLQSVVVCWRRQMGMSPTQGKLNLCGHPVKYDSSCRNGFEPLPIGPNNSYCLIPIKLPYHKSKNLICMLFLETSMKSWGLPCLFEKYFKDFSLL